MQAQTATKPAGSNPAVENSFAALAKRFFELGWIKRREGNRSVEVTARGRARFSDELGIDPV